LVVDHGLTKENIEESWEACQIARALTMNILRALDEKEKRNQVIFFLRSLDLLGVPQKLNDAQSETAIRNFSVLSHIDLSYSDLQGLKAIEVDFHHANLFRADLSDATLFGANLGLGDLRYTDFSRANLIHTRFLVRTHLTYANFSESDLRGSNFSGAYLEGTHFMGANLTGANLSDANLSGSSFIKAKLRGAVLRKIFIGERSIDGEKLRGIDFAGADLTNSDLRDIADLKNANFTQAILEKTILSSHLSEDQQKQCKSYNPTIE
ncbi:pentapeptide repeat-containing protein, partial [Synechococcus moorigangaii CMS01]|nr:pentapeptide repeat-containing protein [Synechococcus moorigangaii CMS01]